MMACPPSQSARTAAPHSTHADYPIGVICALAIEKAAFEAMLDQVHDRLPSPPGDDNCYTLGRMGVHNIVVASLPAGMTGNNSAATVAKDMLRSFPIKIGLMVGIGGGVWSQKVDVRLGDVVVSQPDGTHGGVVQWDFGKMEKGGIFRRTGTLNKPPRPLLHAVQEIKTKHILEGDNLGQYLSEMAQNKPRMAQTIGYPGAEHDQLFDASYDHTSDETCDACDRARMVVRPHRTNLEPVIHYGTIASGNEVIKHGETRDRIAREEGVLCFEMEAAGLMDSFPCLVIRGICDYADSHKSKRWQPYAAATAAAFAKKLLSVIRKQEVDVLESVHSSLHHFMVPFDRNDGFVGREAILAQLLERIPPSAKQDECQRTAIEGLGGIGKTQLALEAAYRVRDDYPDCSVFWVPAVDATSFENAYREIGQALGVQGLMDDKADVKALVRAALSQENSGDWLLVIDNTDDVGLATTFSEHFPTSRKGSILFTTRNHAILSGLDIQPEDVQIVGEMSREEALQMLKKNVRVTQWQDTTSTAELLDFLADLPLAIRQASAYIFQNGISTKQYLRLCQASNTAMIDLLSRPFHDRHRYKAVEKKQNPIATTWLVSFQHISEYSPQAAEYLKSMCFLAEKDIPLSLLPNAGTLKMVEAMGTLKGYAFITEQQTADSYDIHRLVRLTMRNWLREQGNHKEVITKTIQWLSREFPFPEHENKPIWIRYLPHAQAVLQSEDDCTDERARCDLLSNVGIGNDRLGKYEEAEQIHRQTLKLRRKVLGVEHPSTLFNMNNLAEVYRQRGKYEEAEQIHRQALELKGKVLGVEHPSTLDSMNNLANVLDSQGKYEEAEQIHRQTLKLRGKVLGVEHPSTLFSMNNLALVFDNQGKYEEAEQIHRQALELKGKVLGVEHPSTLDSMNNLANVLDNQGKYEEAEQMHRQTLKLKEKVLDVEHPSTLDSMNNLALVFNSQGKYEEAEQIHRQALELKEKVLGVEHPSTLDSMNNLAEVYRQRGKYEEAEQIHRQALELKGKVLGVEHPSTLDSMNNLAVVFNSQGKYEEAEQMHRQELNLCKQICGVEHPSTLSSMNNLALVLDNQGKYEEAEQIHRQTLKLRGKVLGVEHPNTLSSMNNLANVLDSQGKYGEAEQIHRQTLKLRGKVLGVEHPDTLDSMNNLANVLDSQGKYEEAEQMHRQVLELMEKVLGVEHPDMIQSRNNLRACLEAAREGEASRASGVVNELPPRLLETDGTNSSNFDQRSVSGNTDDDEEGGAIL
ncbi:violaceus kinesin [Xylariales sp. PMI_506]|nr:violaceus kinesin [Xylariales sp. PMI_506]